MTATAAQETAPETAAPVREVVVIGSGFGGIAVVHRLHAMGVTDLVVLERGPDVGGTWRDNTYPGAACDVPSNLYSLSFAPNPDWSAFFSPQPEIRAYLEKVAADVGMRAVTRFDHEVTAARWDGAASCWVVETTGGTYRGRVLVSAAGALADPKLPDIPGLETFGGEVWHSSRWRHDVDLAGRRVGVIGTGASAIQLVPHVQAAAAHLTLFQRTASWVLPRIERRTTATERRLFRRVPAAQRAVRGVTYGVLESMVPGLVHQPRLLAGVQAVAKRHLAKQVADPALRARLTPHFRFGCKRLLMSNTWYPALAADNAEVVTEGIDHVEPGAVVTRDGVRHELDTLILATGFQATELPIAARITGTDGRTLREHWSAGIAAHRGTTVAGFPNLFLLLGPNTGLGHTSQVYMLEAQTEVVAGAVAHLRAQGLAAVEPLPAAQEAWNAGIQHAMRRSVWTTGGCASWYLDARGHNTTLWPGQTFRFRRETARFDPAEYAELPF